MARPLPFAGGTVALLYGALPPRPAKDDLDTLKEVEAVGGALQQLGYRPVPLPLTLDLRRGMDELTALAPAFVFNLVESLAGSGRLIHLAPALLDRMGIPYTGAPTEAVFTTSGKVVSKRLLDAFGIPTTPWTTVAEVRAGRLSIAPPFIVKHAWEHASLGVNEEGVVPDSAALRQIIDARRAVEGEDLYVETYVEGREFSVAMVGQAANPYILHPSEILFLDYPAGKPKIVDYRAKWEEESFEYTHTPRQFEFPAADASLLAALKDLARRCWDAFAIAGYCRVDFRVDGAGRPLVMEINTNPCISPDAGFAATAEEEPWDYVTLVHKIVEAVAPAGAAAGEAP